MNTYEIKLNKSSTGIRYGTLEQVIGITYGETEEEAINRYMSFLVYKFKLTESEQIKIKPILTAVKMGTL